MEKRLKMGPDDSKEIFDRLSKTETSVATITEAVKSLATNQNAFIDETRTANAELRRDIKGVREAKTQWGVLLTAVAVSVTIITAIGNSWIAPISVHQSYIRGDIESDRVQIDHNRNDIAVSRTEAARTAGSLRDKLQEVETQFGWAVDAMNQDRAHRIRMEGIMWQKLFGEPLPLLHVNPIGPKRKNTSED